MEAGRHRHMSEKVELGGRLIGEEIRADQADRRRKVVAWRGVIAPVRG